MDKAPTVWYYYSILCCVNDYGRYKEGEHVALCNNRLLKRIVDEDNRQMLLYTFICGLIAHGVMLFNKLCWHDDLDHGFSLLLEKPVAMGRWMRAYLAWFVAKVFGGGYNLSMPLFHGLFSLLFIAAFSCIVAELFDIRQKGTRMVLCGLMVTFPVVTSTFGYMFTAPYYFLALVLSGAAVCIIRNKTGPVRFLGGALCVCCSLGIYQSYFAVTVSLVVIRIIFDIADGKFTSLGEIVKRIVRDIGMCVVGLALYYVIWKVSMKLLGLAASDYQGISTIGETGLQAMLKGALRAYQRFFLKFKLSEENVYPMGIKYVQILALGLSAVSGLLLVVKRAQKSVAQAIVLALLIAVLPMCFNLIYLMTATATGAWIHTLMLYGQAMLYVFLICAASRLFTGRPRLARASRGAVIAVLGLLVLMNAYLSNGCYLKAEMMQQQVITDMTVLVARIKSTEGYNDKMPVAFLMTGKRDATFPKNSYFSKLKLVPFENISPYHNKRNLENTLEYWCGFAPKFVSSSKFKKLPEVEAMPDYPDDGSIRIIDDTVVIKW